jgi:hypothetical protein
MMKHTGPPTATSVGWKTILNFVGSIGRGPSVT